MRYNAGSGHLAAGDPDAAALLEQATEAAPPELAPAAWYNLGNARLSASNAQGAVDAYREALLRRPDFAAAKHNLELALRGSSASARNSRSNRSRTETAGAAEEAGAARRGREEPEEQQPKPQTGQDEPQQGDQGEQGQDRQRPLPRFRDQKDMTAEQAAAILQAVENLERQQRREQALEQARTKAPVEKDW